ncbi:uncharacterized protein Eint_110250 [Encephalitozoon intestinalis ATCC 50506]|uniref:Uncharacterized protein n=1 Tax=Encephalitozoon intestinalis (strain ATCC 50506) TaxID=876142 RepID=E0SAA1_ENCIT|nr:uncharacterized protein Eint_110250 [Encephalitozoon intestinalis ATCC 50506]ADM12526.1 hypothetical protein Eint_110250 [Encephalitozoon intestinalis ATCC 50506]UTX46379.1 proteasome non-ATPase regulatory subunit 8-like protein [Encephalitozoon intestinalis]
MNKQLNEVESLCLTGIKKGDPEMVEMYFGPYLSCSPSTDNSALIKAYMLLYYLSTGSKKTFYTTIETVTSLELSDPCIRLAMEVDMCVSIGAVERLRRLIEGNGRKEFDQFLKGVLENQMKIMESSINYDDPRLEIQSQEDKKVIEDVTFIGRNLPANF